MLTPLRSHSQLVEDPAHRTSLSFLIHQLWASEPQTVQKNPQQLWIMFGRGCKSYTHTHMQMCNTHTATSWHHLGPRILSSGNKGKRKGQKNRHTYRNAGVEWSGLSHREALASLKLSVFVTHIRTGRQGYCKQINKAADLAKPPLEQCL